ncbi:mannosyltransferase [Tilletia horrida]|nr:mannosyltransferase [Tilletia horrida]
MFVPALIALGLLGASLLFPLCVCLYIALHRASANQHARRLRSKAKSGSRATLLNKRSAAVVVLGDVGRSPRMCYHAESLANEGWKVGLVGYHSTTLPPTLQRPSVRSHPLLEPPKWFAKLPRAAFILFVAPSKLLIQSLSLFWALGVQVHPPPELILVQTPPALPTLFIVRFVAWLLSARVIIDWHNLGYTILGLRLGPAHRLVRFAEWLERITGRKAFAHLFVTHAMKRHLEAAWKLKGHKAVLHDRPPVHFKRAQTQETHALFCDLTPRLKPTLGDFWPTFSLPNSTPFTCIPSRSANSKEPQLRDDRPALAVSSTSWTADEDFDILLEAARKYEFRAQRLATQYQHHPHASSSASSTSSVVPPGGLSAADDLLLPNSPLHRPSSSSSSSSQTHSNSASSPPIRRLPKLLIIVTGKGQLRAHYEQLIATAEKEERWKYVRIRTAWLEVEEYPVLLGSADIGISLHSSSSGLDLPMKVVDMLGCGLPTLALSFPCLPELISHGRNGLVFSSAGQLAEQLAQVVHSGMMASLPSASPRSSPPEVAVTSDEAARGAVGSGLNALGEGGAGAGRNWMVKAMQEDEALAFGWGDEPLESVVAASLLAAAASEKTKREGASSRRSSFHFSRNGGSGSGGMGPDGGGNGSGLPTYSGTSTPTLARSSIDSPPTSTSLVSSPSLGSHSAAAAAGQFPSTFASSSSSYALEKRPAARTAQEARHRATWTGNWRRVVRPLLDADEDDDDEDGEEEGGKGLHSVVAVGAPNRHLDADDEGSVPPGGRTRRVSEHRKSLLVRTSMEGSGAEGMLPTSPVSSFPPRSPRGGRSSLPLLRSPLASPARTGSLPVLQHQPPPHSPSTPALTISPSDDSPPSRFASVVTYGDEQEAERGSPGSIGNGSSFAATPRAMNGAQQLDSHWSPGAASSGGRRGSASGSSSGGRENATGLDLNEDANSASSNSFRKSWSAGDGDVPDIRVSLAMS